MKQLCLMQSVAEIPGLLSQRCGRLESGVWAVAGREGQSFVLRGEKRGCVVISPVAAYSCVSLSSDTVRGWPC